jgi:hypothetical protein
MENQEEQQDLSLTAQTAIKEKLRDTLCDNISELLRDTPIVTLLANPKVGQTFGQIAVGTSFNPSADSRVDFAKQLQAMGIDLMRLVVAEGGGKARRLNSYYANRRSPDAYGKSYYMARLSEYISINSG